MGPKTGKSPSDPRWSLVFRFSRGEPATDREHANVGSFGFLTLLGIEGTGYARCMCMSQNMMCMVWAQFVGHASMPQYGSTGVGSVIEWCFFFFGL